MYVMTDFIYNNQNRKNARQKLRKDATKEEVMLWSRLRNNGIGFKFRRQYSVRDYIIDFYCPAKRLVVELDGSQHKTNKEYDTIRTKLFEELNIRDLNIIKLIEIFYRGFNIKRLQRKSFLNLVCINCFQIF